MRRLALVLLLAGCAQSRPEEAPPRPMQETPQQSLETDQIEALHGRLKQMDDELSGVLAQPKPRCERQCKLQQEMCELSERICGIAQRHAEDEGHDYAETCRDGRARCLRAKQQVSACNCPAP